MLCDGTQRESEFVGNELVRVTECHVRRHLTLADRQRAQPAGLHVIAVCHDEAPAIALDAVDERPTTIEHAAPQIERRVRIRAAQTSPRLFYRQSCVAERFTSTASLGDTFGVEDGARG